MSFDPLRTAAVGIAALALSACATSGGQMDIFPDNSTWGDANRMTMAAQIVDPDPQYDTPIPPTSAVNAVNAADAYRDKTVEQPEAIRTTEGGGGPN